MARDVWSDLCGLARCARVILETAMNVAMLMLGMIGLGRAVEDVSDDDHERRRASTTSGSLGRPVGDALSDPFYRLSQGVLPRVRCPVCGAPASIGGRYCEGRDGALHARRRVTKLSP